MVPGNVHQSANPKGLPADSKETTGSSWLPLRQERFLSLYISTASVGPFQSTFENIPIAFRDRSSQGMIKWGAHGSTGFCDKDRCSGLNFFSVWKCALEKWHKWSNKQKNRKSDQEIKIGVKSESRSWYTASLDLGTLHLEFRHLLLVRILSEQHISWQVLAVHTQTSHCSGQASALAGFSHVDVLLENLKVAEVFLLMECKQWFLRWGCYFLGRNKIQMYL